mmetsp:Transcript_115072/g.223561  ORF Transcript_115072/g.223561 Transcript_115072/m.223561 type:complete len:645 (+) Transcript_115072:88-2022(+)
MGRRCDRRGSRSRSPARRRSASQSEHRHVATPARNSAGSSIGHRVVLTRRKAEHAEESEQQSYAGTFVKRHKPPPRPGFDTDKRLEQMDDDPRYAEGAELGKAQRAALGERGLNGRNTASFDPNSTLVRPTMRLMHAKPQKRLGRQITPDDVIAVPNFVVAEDHRNMYDSLVAEFKQCQASESGCDLDDAPTCQQLLKKICRYFSIDADSCTTTLMRFRPEKKDASITLSVGSRGNRTKVEKANCTMALAFGAVRELAFWRSAAEDSIYFPLRGGCLLFWSRDVTTRWKSGIGAVEQLQGKGSVIMLSTGNCNALEEERVLANYDPSIKAQKQGPCRDFKLGRCSYGDRCRFSHGNDRQEESMSSFNPTTAVVRPSMRVITLAASARYPEPVKHDDVIIVPSFFEEAEGWDIYYDLIKEMRQCQARGERKSEWVPWHEGAHLLSQNPEGSATYHRVLDRISEYFDVPKDNRGTRFNWYRDGSDWKPFHHDSAAFNKQRASTQNCTIGVSFGTSRELAFRHAKTEELVYIPQTNGMLFYFGRDTNIRWQHGINSLPSADQDGKGRISIILWGWCSLAVDEPGSPPMLDDGSRGKCKGKGRGKGGKGGFSMHSQSGTGDRVAPPCRDFQRGRCSRGERCHFSHNSL